MQFAREAVICTPIRTALGTYNGTLRSTPATDLGAISIRAALSCSGLDPAKIDSAVMGNVIQAGNKMNPARQGALGGGLPVEAPALTVNRVCGSVAPAFEAAVPILSHLLKAELAEREVRSIAYHLKAARFPAYKDLSGFDFVAREI